MHWALYQREIQDNFKKQSLEDHRTKAQFSKVAFALRRLVSKPRKLVPAKYGFRKQVGWGVKSLKNM